MESTVRVVLIDPSVYGGLGASEGGDGEGHSLESSETRENMGDDCRGVRMERPSWCPIYTDETMRWLPSGGGGEMTLFR